MAKSRYDFFLSASGESGGPLAELELKHLKNLGATSNNLDEAWMQYLASQGYTSGGFNDRLYNWLGSKGYEGGLNDRLYQLYQSEESASSPALSTFDLTVGNNVVNYGFSEGLYGNINPNPVGGVDIRWLIFSPDDRIFFRTLSAFGVDAVLNVNGEDVINISVQGLLIRSVRTGNDYFTSAGDAVAGTFEAISSQNGSTITVEIFAGI